MVAELRLEMPWSPSYDPSKLESSLCRSVARSIGRSIDRSIDRSHAPSPDRSLRCSIDRSIARPFFLPVPKPIHNIRASMGRRNSRSDWMVNHKLVKSVGQTRLSSSHHWQSSDFCSVGKAQTIFRSVGSHRPQPANHMHMLKTLAAFIPSVISHSSLAIVYRAYQIAQVKVIIDSHQFIHASNGMSQYRPRTIICCP